MHGRQMTKAERSMTEECRNNAMRAGSHQKLAVLHHLLAIKPDIEVASDTIDMRFRLPIGPGVLGVGMPKGDMNAGDLLVLQNVSDHSIAGSVGADREFAHSIAVLIHAGVSAKILQ